jgi:hypothetical protein
VIAALKAKGVVAMRADVTEPSLSIDAYALMEDLGNSAKNVPFLAIFPADRPDQPHIFKEELYTKEDLLKLIDQLPAASTQAAVLPR